MPQTRSLGLSVRALVAFAFAGACGGSTPLDPAGSLDGGHAAAPVIPAPGAPCSVEGVTGATAGVKLSIRSAKCVYRVGEAATFTYEVTTDANVAPVSTAASQSCGRCTPLTSDPMSVVDYAIGGASSDGRAQKYCVCDVGCCAPDTARTVTMAAVTESAIIEWSGRNWYGPSDTNTAPGAFFPPGHYDVTVTFDRGAVRAKLPIEIVP